MFSYLTEELATPHYFLILIIIVFMAFYLYDFFVNAKCGCRRNVEDAMNFYSYDERDGPPCWKTIFADADGKRQSPINLLESVAQEIPSDIGSPLLFSKNFHTFPSEMNLYNNCHNIVLHATWASDKKPYITGGPLEEIYDFTNIRFRWGPNDQEGSEHMINSTRYSMELQVAFIKRGTSEEDVVIAANNGSLLMLSYLFLITPLDNPYLEPIVASLKHLKNPLSYLSIEPIILSLLIPPFSRDYYTYTGSLSFPPCTEGVLWIVKPEPLMVSSKQIRQFRRVKGCFGKIESNTRPVQSLNSRELKYYF